MTRTKQTVPFVLRSTVPVRSYYAVLGVQRTASDKAIRAAYLALSKQHHPDAGGREEDFKAVTEAYSVLKDHDRRAVYDKRTAFLGRKTKCPACKGEGTVYRTVGFTRRVGKPCAACSGTGQLGGNNE